MIFSFLTHTPHRTENRVLSSFSSFDISAKSTYYTVDYTRYWLFPIINNDIPEITDAARPWMGHTAPYHSSSFSLSFCRNSLYLDGRYTVEFFRSLIGLTESYEEVGLSCMNLAFSLVIDGRKCRQRNFDRNFRIS